MMTAPGLALFYGFQCRKNVLATTIQHVPDGLISLLFSTASSLVGEGNVLF